MTSSISRIHFVIVIAGSTHVRGVRGSRRPADLYVTGVSFADGDGLKIKSFKWNRGQEDAKQFSKSTAETISQQLNGPGFRLKSRVEKVEATQSL